MPRYVIADPDIAKQIAVKNFSHFIDRAPVSTVLENHSLYTSVVHSYFELSASYTKPLGSLSALSKALL